MPTFLSKNLDRLDRFSERRTNTTSIYLYGIQNHREKETKATSTRQKLKTIPLLFDKNTKLYDFNSDLEGKAENDNSK